ncbi:MAG: HAMP domain-containing histidine kinase [Gemmatimonadota bacterium]|nr:HAMP domain-containing histidine kinase [Gemmatimonadota bacterium]MDH3422919.1 HAMP domain-containing histidine kinase [Gemmatimonadota bacterium]
MEVLIGIVAGIVLGALGLAIGRSSGRKAGLEEGSQEVEARLRSLVEAVRRGKLQSDVSSGTPEAALQEALKDGWAPREAERQAALREAVGRVSSFLQKSVREPLQGFGEHADAGELRERISRALGALEDLDFFVREADQSRQGTDLSALTQRVSKEFVTDQGMGVRLLLSDVAVRASVNAAALMDALYLVLHNASRFGEGRTVDLTVTSDGGRAKITVRDRGDGFSEEAFRRAFDPFYSTSDDGLGLGLPHARKVIEGMGGRIDLRNVPDGGAEVEISFPT